MQALKTVGHHKSVTIAAALSLLLGTAHVVAGPGGGGHGGGGHGGGAIHGGGTGGSHGGGGFHGGGFRPGGYADNNYYLWDQGAGEYLQVEPPENLAATSPSDSSPEATPLPSYSNLFAYPKNGQSEEQQKRDRQECRQWATNQTGIDPTATTSSQGDLDKRQSYLRAEAACLEGRDYSVK